MRDLSVVKETRNELRSELVNCIKKVKEMQVDEKTFRDLSQYDQQVYIYLDRTVQRLRTQINALEFVLNEDTEIADAFADRAAEKHKINKETVFNAPERESNDENGYRLDLTNLN